MRALLSVSNKTGLVPFASALAARGVELVSTGGPPKPGGGGLPVVGISDVTGMPEMMDGRVKTLHPRVHAGILARRHRADDRAALAEHGITPIDLVVVNLYPFAQAAAKPDLPFDELVEEIDIGGPSLLRAAAKSFHDVLVVVEPEDYERVIAALGEASGPSLALRFDLARRAFAHTAAYDQMIASTLDGVRVDGGGFTREPVASGGPLPAVWAPRLRKAARSAVGENPHQAGAWYAPEVRAPGLATRSCIRARGSSFTNLLDLDAGGADRSQSSRNRPS
jgi:phosphoribosylaminoimidazolecarboxamide formyltransferase/IMP cyclohydrolase